MNTYTKPIKTALTILAVILLFTWNFSPVTAHAETPYLRVTETGVYFFAEPVLGTEVFELPTSYYVKNVGEVGDFYHIECYGASSFTPLLDGYVLKTSVTPSNTDNPYLSLTVKTANSTVMYEDFSLTKSIQYIFKERTLGYYGMMNTDQGIIYFVSYNSKIGYVKEVDLSPFSVPLHPTPIETKSPPNSQPQSPSDSTQNNQNGASLKITVIVSLGLATLIILALIVVPEKKSRIED